MESSNPIIPLPNLFSEDYKHFESTCKDHPEKAEVVFGYVADLRAALQAFREATTTVGSKVDAVQVDAPDTTASPETPAAAVLVGSVEGSVEKGGSPEVVEKVITLVDECCAKTVEVIG